MCRCFKIFLPFIILLLSRAFPVFSQIETGEKPYSLTLKADFTEPPVITMPRFDYNELRKKSLEEVHLKALRYAKMIDVDVSLKQEAQATPIGEGTLYRLALHSKDAYSLSMVFDEFRIPPGANLFVYNEDQTHIRGAFTSRNNKPSHVFPIAPVKGDKVIIEYFEPDNRAFDGILNLDRVGHDFIGIYNSMGKDIMDLGSSCENLTNWDINCPAGANWQTAKHAVVKILIQENSTALLCTGSLINNVRYNRRPYVLTANHCLNSQEDAEATVAIFNYEVTECDGNELKYENQQSVSGANLIATTPEIDQLDFSLIEMSESIPVSYKPYYAGWSLRTNNIQQAVTIHHPEGDVKKISIDSNTVETKSFPGMLYNDTSHWLINEWEIGTTQGGSSGAPLFNQNKRIIGDLSGGRASCDNPIDDYFAKFSRSWDDFGIAEYQLKAWLDPDSSNFEYLDGYLPYDSIPSHLKAQYESPAIQLSWNPPLDSGNVQDYEIYRDGGLLASVQETGFSDNAVEQDSLYHYKLRAHLGNGNYTDFTKEIPYLAGDLKTLPFTENFTQLDTLPAQWYEYNYQDKQNWSVKEGGANNSPDNAAEGQYNLLFEGEADDSAKLITPRVNLSGEEYVHLRYFVALPDNNGNVDHLNIYIRYSDTLKWHRVRSYRESISGWQYDTLYLPRPTDEYRVAFEGVDHNGGGVVLDAVEISRDTNAVKPGFQVSNQRVCEEEFLHFTTNTTGFESYSWDFGYGAHPRYASGPQPHTVRYTEPGEKTVKLTINGIYQTTVKNALIVDTLPPRPSINVNRDTLSVPGEGEIQWYYEENAVPMEQDSIPGAYGNIYIAEDVGVYRVKVTNQYGCSVFSDTLNYAGPNLTTPATNQKGQLKVYPVPSGERFYIQYTADRFYKARLTMVNTLGTVVKEKEIEFHQGVNKKSLNGSGLSPGIYFIRIHLPDGGILHSRLIRQ